ncbi:MAG: hypothetical protein LBN39_10565 [Planctomycetaceae bacterium]|jgi:hypothetical protein|nr:hypothetical protein [Planctomycetaceae bacterium]
MKNETCQVLTAADIDNRLREQFADDYESHRLIPDWLADYVSDVPAREVADWERAVFGKRAGREERNTERNARTTETGSWGFPASADLPF